MKKTILYIGLSILLLNIIAGLLLSAYHPFNMMVNSLIIVVNTAMIMLLSHTKQKTVFVISLSFLFCITEVIQLVFGCIMPEQYKDNWQLMVIMAILIIEIVLFVIANSFSKNKK